MHRLREDGWTMIEILTVLAIVGVMSTMAVASLKSYSRREDARSAARSVAGLLERARGEALSSGRMTWVVFQQPVNGVAPFADGQFAALIYDTNNDLQPDGADKVTPINLPSGVSNHAFMYDTASSPFQSAGLPDADQSRDIADGSLTNTVEGTTLNVDAFMGVPAIGFSSQGIPVKAGTPLDPGSGAGAVYMTDNESSVVAILVLPLGDVRTMAWDTGSGKWR